MTPVVDPNPIFDLPYFERKKKKVIPCHFWNYLILFGPPSVVNGLHDEIWRKAKNLPYINTLLQQMVPPWWHPITNCQWQLSKKCHAIPQFNNTVYSGGKTPLLQVTMPYMTCSRQVNFRNLQFSGKLCSELPYSLRSKNQYRII